MKKLLVCLGVVAAVFAACDSTPKFQVQGAISGADDQTLYLENVGLNGVEILDSTKLSGAGKFELKGAAPASPEFYRLRIDQRIVNFSVDSTETIKISAPFDNMAEGYTIEGEENLRIKDLAIRQITLQRDVNAISQSKSLLPGEIQDSVMNTLTRYKEQVMHDFIYAGPDRASAYFALFQTLNGYFIFDPVNNKADVRCFAAVATSWDNKYPQSERAGNLHNIAIRGMKSTRAPQVRDFQVDESKIKETNSINVSLADLNGVIRNSNDLEGKVVLLDFTIYNHQASAARNMQLRQIYDKFKDRGLEIYQVSLDADEHFWKTNADNLPWICVRDPKGVNSNYMLIYGVNDLPTYFLLDRTNAIRARTETIQDLEAEINKYL